MLNSIVPRQRKPADVFRPNKPTYRCLLSWLYVHPSVCFSACRYPMLSAIGRAMSTASSVYDIEEDRDGGDGFEEGGTTLQASLAASHRAEAKSVQVRSVVM